MVELADSLDSGSSVQYARAGSSPASRTILGRQLGEQAGVHLFLRAPPLNRGLLSFLHQLYLTNHNGEQAFPHQNNEPDFEAVHFFGAHAAHRGQLICFCFFAVPFAPVSVQLSVLPMKKPLTHRVVARIVSGIIMYLKLICSSFSGFELKLKFSIWMHRYLLYCLAPERIGIVRPLFSS